MSPTVDGDHLEASLTGVSLGIPPAFVDRPRPSPVPHLDPFATSGEHEWRCRQQPASGDDDGVVAIVEHLDRDRLGQDSGG